MSEQKKTKVKVLFEVPAIINNTTGSAVQTVLINGEELSSDDIGVGDKVIYPDGEEHAKISGAILSTSGMLYVLSKPQTSLPSLKAGDELTVVSVVKHKSVDAEKTKKEEPKKEEPKKAVKPAPSKEVTKKEPKQKGPKKATGSTSGKRNK